MSRDVEGRHEKNDNVESSRCHHAWTHSSHQYQALDSAIFAFPPISGNTTSAGLSHHVLLLLLFYSYIERKITAFLCACVYKERSRVEPQEKVLTSQDLLIQAQRWKLALARQPMTSKYYVGPGLVDV